MNTYFLCELPHAALELPERQVERSKAFIRMFLG